jgi:carbonic anhydrase
MKYLELLARNVQWAEKMQVSDPTYFERLAATHTPSTLFIGCADARTPLNLVTDTGLGELFIHRNIANQVHPADTSFSASLQYAVDVLRVTDVVVCGHLGCGGVRAALSPDSAPDHVEAWIAQLRMLARLHDREIAQCNHDEHKVDKLVELNVIEQVRLLARHPTVRKAWNAGQTLRLHGWVFDMPRGLLVPKIEALSAPEVYLIENGERRAAV